MRFTLKHSTPRRLLIGLLSSGLTVAAANPLVSQSPSLNRPDLWSDPSFLEAFTGSYGFRGESEPAISSEEKELFERIAKLAPNNPQAAIDTLQNGLTPQSSAALDFTLANLLYETGQLVQAEPHYRRALEKFPNFRRAHQNLGFLYVETGRLEKALEQLLNAVKQGSHNGTIFGLIGYCRLEKNHYAGAEAAYRNALMHRENHSNWKLGLARALLEQERVREAEAILKELTLAAPEEAGYWLHLANASLRLEKPLQAMAALEWVRRLDQATPDTLVRLGNLYLNEGLVNDALGVYKTAWDQNPNKSIDGLIRAGSLLANRGEWPAVEDIVGMLQKNSRKSESDRAPKGLLRLKARLKLQKNQSKEAIPILEEIIGRDPLDGESLLVLADAYAANDQLSNAHAVLDRAARIEGVKVEALWKKGQLLVREGEYKAATEYLEQAQAIEANPRVERYLEILRKTQGQER